MAQSELQELAELEELDKLEAIERASRTKADKEAVNPVGMKRIPFPRGGTVLQPEDPLRTAREGVGSGMVRAGRGLTNILVKAMNAQRGAPSQGDMPEFASDEAIQEQDRLDKPLSEVPEGAASQMAGQVAATLPLGGVPRAAGAAVEGAPMLARALASPATHSALEGSINAAAAADPEHQGEAAVMGAAGSAALTKLGQALKRTVGGLAQPGEAANHLEQFAEQHGKDIFIPLAQSVDDSSDLPSRLIKTLYKEALPMIPGASGQLKSQGKRLAGDVREIALKEADFKGVLTPDDLADPEAAVGKLRKSIDDEVGNTVKKYTFRVPDRKDLISLIKAKMPGVDDVTMNKVATQLDEHFARFSSNKDTIAGHNLLNTQRQFADDIKKLKGPELEAAQALEPLFDDIIEKRLTMSQFWRNTGDLERYQATKEPAANLAAAEKAVQSAVVKKGQFTPAQLVKAAAKTSDTQRHLGQTADEVLSQNVSGVSPAGRMVAYGALGGAGYFNPLAALGIVGGGNTLATELSQDLLMGRTGPQQALIEALRGHKTAKALRYLGTAGRSATAEEIGDDNGPSR